MGDGGHCTNIHAGETLSAILDRVERHVPAIKATLSPRAPFGLGLRLSASPAGALTAPAARDEARARIAALDAYVFTVNASPYGPFHGTPVKADVYEPDWRADARRRFTADAALLPAGMEGRLSTVPGAFRPVGRQAGAVPAIVAGLVAAVADLVAVAASIRPPASACSWPRRARTRAWRPS